MVWGALLAGGISLASSYLASRKKKKKEKKRSTLDPQQQRLQNAETQALLEGSGPLADVYSFNPEKASQAFNQYYAQPAYQNFQENVIPSITGQFRGRNLGNSSYAGQALARAGRDVQANINSEMGKYLYDAEQAALSRRSQGLNNAMGRTTFDYQRPTESSFDSMLNRAGGQATEFLLNRYLPMG